MIGWEIITYLEGSAPEKHLLQPVDKEFRERIGHSLFLWSTSRKNVKTRPIFHENMAVFWHFLAMNGKLWVQNIVFYSYLVPEMIWWKVHENRMLGSAQTKLPPLTVTSWVKGTSSFGPKLKIVLKWSCDHSKWPQETQISNGDFFLYLLHPRGGGK